MIAPRGRRKIRWIEIIQAVNLTSPPKAKSSQWLWSRILIFRTWQVCSRCPSRIGPLSNPLGNMDLWGSLFANGFGLPSRFWTLRVFYHIHCIVLYFEYCIKGFTWICGLAECGRRSVEFAENWICWVLNPQWHRPCVCASCHVVRH
jgi:hypothetical protein